MTYRIPPTPESNNLSSPAESGFLSETRQKLTALVAVGALAFTGATAAQAIEPSQAKANTATAEELSPQALSQQASLLVANTVQAWKNHQTADGRFIDPVLGGGVKTYGAAMIGQAMVETGAALNDDSLINSGINALMAQTRNPDDDGFNVGFEVFGMAGAVSTNDKLLATNQNWLNTRNNIVSFIQQRSLRKPSGEVGKCFAKDCYSNLRLVQILAKVGLSGAKIENGIGARAASTDSQTVSAASFEMLGRAAKNTSSNARRIGGMSFNQAGIVSDPTVNPLAYHSLSSMLIGRIIQQQGYENTSPAVRTAFMRSAKAIVGLMGPNGDVSYVGRGQGQVWNLAASADALATAAKYETNPEWRGRYLGAYARVINLLQTDYTPGSHGMPVVPSHKGAKASRKGLERYVSTIGYNGLALNALSNSINTLKEVQSAPNKGIASDTQGVFIDSSQAKFATVRRGDLWYAVHGSTTNKDARYGFGIMAAQRVQPNGSSRDIMPHRPYTKDRIASGGPVIKIGGRELVPVAQRMTAQANGAIKIVGGWSSRPNHAPTTDRNTNITFTPRGNNAVSLSFRSKKKHSFEFEVWGAKGAKSAITKRGITITEADGDRVKYSFNRNIQVTKSQKADASSYDQNLTSYTVKLKAKAGQKVEQLTTFG